MGRQEQLLLSLNEPPGAKLDPLATVVVHKERNARTTQHNLRNGRSDRGLEIRCLGVTWRVCFATIAQANAGDFHGLPAGNICANGNMMSRQDMIVNIACG